MSLELDVENMVKASGYELYEASIVSRSNETIYEVLVTNKEGVELDVCAEISHNLSALLDVTPPVKGEYRLEVGSAGIERKLRTLSHFSKSIGEKAKVTLITGEHFVGEILAVNENMISIDDKEQGKVDFNFDEIQKARTYFEW